MPDSLVLATRGSKLAIAQSEWVRDELQRLHEGLHVELLILKTTGDQVLDTALPQIAGKGLFTKEIEEGRCWTAGRSWRHTASRTCRPSCREG